MSDAQQDEQVSRAVRAANVLLEAEAEQRKRAQRKQLMIGAAVAVAAAGAGVWYFVLRDTSSACDRMLGSAADLQAIANRPFKLGHGYANKYSCRAEADAEGSTGAFAVEIEVENGNSFDMHRQHAASEKYASHEMFGTALGDAVLFVAGDAKDVSMDELEAAARRNVGYSRDPMGDALAALPPAQHVVFMAGHGETITIELDRKMFTPAQAKAFALAVAQRAK